MSHLVVQRACTVSTHGSSARVQSIVLRCDWAQARLTQPTSSIISRRNASSTRSTQELSQSLQLRTDFRFAVKGVVPDLSSTRPARWELPEAPNPWSYPNRNSMNPTRWDFKYLFELGKAVAKFYKAGVKNVWFNYKTTRQLRKRFVKLQAAVGRARKITPEVVAKYSVDPDTALSYNEYMLIKRSESDVKKLLPFGLVFVVCGEFTPLVIPILPTSFVPATCKIPKQVNKELKALLRREEKAFQAAAQLYLEERRNVLPIRSVMKEYDRKWGILSAYLHGLTPRPTYPTVLGRLYWQYYLENKLRKHSDELVARTAALVRHGGPKSLEPQELWDYANSCANMAAREYLRLQSKLHPNDLGLEHVATEELKRKILPSLELNIREMLKKDFESAQEGRPMERFAMAAGWHNTSSECESRRKALLPTVWRMEAERLKKEENPKKKESAIHTIEPRMKRKADK